MSKVKWRPIIFQGWGVKAILEGRKTQTRRVLKPQPIGYDVAVDVLSYDHGVFEEKAWREQHSPYGVAGDGLWVRESIRCTPEDVYYLADGMSIRVADLEPDQDFWLQNYGGSRVGEEVTIPSIHMPRWVSRVGLEIVDVHIQRVQDISMQDAVAEGWPDDGHLNNYGTGAVARDWFAEVWDSVNAKREFSWKANPWVWAIEFALLENGNCG